MLAWLLNLGFAGGGEPVVYVTGPFHVEAAQVLVPGAWRGEVLVPGAWRGEVLMPGAQTGGVQ